MKKNSGDTREKVLARRDDVENVLPRRAQVPAIPALVFPTTSTACNKFVNRDHNAAVNIRR